MKHRPNKEFLDNFRALIPQIECPEDCGVCCAHVPWSKFEWDQIPDELKHSVDPFSFQCYFLKDCRCTVHQYRPIACRLFGVVQSMPCPIGVQADEYMMIEEAEAYLEAYKKRFFKDKK